MDFVVTGNRHSTFFSRHLCILVPYFQYKHNVEEFGIANYADNNALYCGAEAFKNITRP